MFLSACKPGIEKENIYGTWTTVNVGAAAPGVTDRIIFTQPDSIRVEIWKYGKIIQVMPGTFTFNQGKRTFSTRYATTEIHFDIKELTPDNFVARQKGAQTFLRMKRHGAD